MNSNSWAISSCSDFCTLASSAVRGTLGTGLASWSFYNSVQLMQAKHHYFFVFPQWWRCLLKDKGCFQFILSHFTSNLFQCLEHNKDCWMKDTHESLQTLRLTCFSVRGNCIIGVNRFRTMMCHFHHDVTSGILDLHSWVGPQQQLPSPPIQSVTRCLWHPCGVASPRPSSHSPTNSSSFPWPLSLSLHWRAIWCE